MEPIYTQYFTVDDHAVDCFGRLKPSTILFYAQEVAGQHCRELSLDYDTLADRRLFWAIIRHKVEVSRLPMSGERIRVETWPMPTTRVAYPRSVVAYDEEGNECFRSISLWVLMDLDTRNMILPGKSGISVQGTVRGTELAAPATLLPALAENRCTRRVSFTDLDRNGHMNNTRHLEWVWDLLPAAFHRDHPVQGFTVCYLSEAREFDELELNWQGGTDAEIRVDAHRAGEDGKPVRVFAVQVRF